MPLETLRTFFGWMTLINLLLYAWSALLCLLARRWIQRLHGRWFGLSPETVGGFLYGYLGAYKIAFIVLNLVPWLALVAMD